MLQSFVGQPEGHPSHLPADAAIRSDQREAFNAGGPYLLLCMLRVTPALVCCRIVRFPWQMGEEKVRRVFREALKIWSDVTPLTFTEIHSGKADIRIDFTR